MKSLILSLGIIGLSACIGICLFVFCFLGVLFTHDGSPVPLWFTLGPLILMLFSNYSILSVLVFFFIPVYWGLLAWLATRVKKHLHLMFCLLFFMLLHIIIPYWMIGSDFREDFFIQLSHHRCRPFLIIQTIIVGIANCYLFALPFVFYWLSRRKSLHKKP